MGIHLWHTSLTCIFLEQDNIEYQHLDQSDNINELCNEGQMDSYQSKNCGAVIKDRCNYSIVIGKDHIKIKVAKVSTIEKYVF